MSNVDPRKRGSLLDALPQGKTGRRQFLTSLGLVAGAALGVNTIIAVCVGGLLPLVLKLLKKDPALAAGPILTTVTDMCGFFLTLGFATILLSRLVGSPG